MVRLNLHFPIHLCCAVYLIKQWAGQLYLILPFLFYPTEDAVYYKHRSAVQETTAVYCDNNTIHTYALWVECGVLNAEAGGT
jgi:hypothetical protein